MFGRTLAIGLMMTPAAIAAPAAVAPAFDGIYGPYTTARVAEFQRAHGLAGDGLAGYQTQRALGMAFVGRLRPGAQGPEVVALQRALAKAGYWAPKQAAARPAARSEASEPGWQRPPSLHTPRPMPLATFEPVPAESAPMPSPSAGLETPAPEEPAWDFRIGTWWLPAPAGQSGLVAGRNPSWTGSITRWWGDWGLGVDVAVVNETYEAMANGPSLAGNIQFADVLAKHRFGRWSVFGGYRGTVFNFGRPGLPQPHFLTLGLAGHWPLGVEWLRLYGQAQGLITPGAAPYFDSEAGVEVNGGIPALTLGYRHFYTPQAITTAYSGPTAALSLRF